MIATATAARDRHPPLRVDLRPSRTSDLPYVLNAWSKHWRSTPACSRLSSAQYAAYFDAMVRRGLMALPDTQLLIGSAESDPDWVWCWLCYTPGLVPTLHYAATRRDIPVRGGVPLPLRGLGMFRMLVQAAGVAGELVYTFKPARSEDEQGLLSAADGADIDARYRSVEEFLSMRRGR